MNLAGLRISGEAMGHFQGHWKRIYKSEPRDWKRTIRKFLKNVKEVNTPSMIPIVIPNCPDVRYFEERSGWFFITTGTDANNHPITLRAVARSKQVR